MNGKLLRQVLDKMLKSPAAGEARVQVCLPDGKYYDITSLQLMENKLIGVRESHRLVFTVKAETWNMGKVLNKIGQPVVVKPETKFWHEIKTFVTKNNCTLSFTRLENSASWGTPDLLGYNSNGIFFTVELKVTKTNKVRFSPHQIAFHVKHPNNSFILVKTLTPVSVKLYQGKSIRELVACGLELDACSLGLEACVKSLEQLGA